MKQRTKHQKAYHGVLARQSCVLCGLLDQVQVTRTTVHHIREGQGMSQRASHWLVVPLCEDCHQGPNGIHGNRSLLRIAKCEELDLLAETIEKNWS